MDKGRRAQEQIPRTMGWTRPTTTLLLLLITFLTSDAALSSRLPKQILMTAVVAPEQQQSLNLDGLYVMWEHDGHPLVEYRNKGVTTYEPRALLPLEEVKDGNVSLILTNLTASDSGNYTCLIEYNQQKWGVLYTLHVEKHRIQLFNLSSKKVEENIEKSVHRLVKLLNRPVKKYARESKAPIKIWGFSPVSAKPGDNISLVCRFSAESSMELTMLDIRWSKDGVTKYIFNGDFQEDQAKLDDLSRGNARLNLTSVQRGDSGHYVCSITYRLWQRNITTLLIVRDDDEKKKIKIAVGERTDAHEEDDSRFRKAKIGMVVGAIAGVNFLALIVFICVAG